MVNRSIKKGFITLYGLTDENEVKVYEISFFGTAKSSTKLIKRIPNVSEINEVYLYNPLSFDPRPYKEENAPSELMFDILTQQLMKLKDSTAMLD